MAQKLDAPPTKDTMTITAEPAAQFTLHAASVGRIDIQDCFPRMSRESVTVWVGAGAGAAAGSCAGAGVSVNAGAGFGTGAGFGAAVDERDETLSGSYEACSGF